MSSRRAFVCSIGIVGIDAFASRALSASGAARVGWRELLVVGCTASIGLTTALFFSTAVLPTGPLLLQMETGALMTAAGVAVAFAAARLLGVGRYHAPSIHGGKS